LLAVPVLVLVEIIALHQLLCKMVKFWVTHLLQSQVVKVASRLLPMAVALAAVVVELEVEPAV
jgi:hypothetical protein